MEQGARVLRRYLVLLLAAPLLAGCFEQAPAAGSAVPVVVLRVGAGLPSGAGLRSPIWSDDGGALLALASDGRVVKVSPPARSPTATGGTTTATATATASAKLPGVGENIEIDPADHGRVCVPQPGLGKVGLLDVDGLREVAGVRAGPAPSYLAVDRGSNVLLALSADRSTVTPIHLPDGKQLAPQQVRATHDAELDGAQRGSYVEYHLVGSTGIAHYKGGVGSTVKRTGDMPVNVSASAGDKFKVSRLYVAQSGTNEVVAVDSKRWIGGLEQVGKADAGAPVRYLGTDYRRLYAATDNALVVFATNSFEGYSNGRIPLLDKVSFRSGLPAALAGAGVSGLAVGPRWVYLTFTGAPYVVAIAEPSG